MGRVGFIHDKLDIKFLILYIASRLIEPVGIDVLTDLALCDEGVDYFSFSECLNELVESEHIKKTEEGLYCATPRGIRNSEICESSIPYSGCASGGPCPFWRRRGNGNCRPGPLPSRT